MKKITNLKASAMLALPLLAIIGGFFIPSLYAAIPLWIIALVVSGLSSWLIINASFESNCLTNFLIFISIYVQGLAILPFALFYLVVCGIFRLLQMMIIGLMALVYRYKEGLKCFFIPLFLYTLIWSLPISLALIKNFWIFTAAACTEILFLYFCISSCVKLVKRHRKRIKYLTFNTAVLWFSICASIIGTANPELISTDWGGLFLLIWMFLSFLCMTITAFLAFVAFAAVWLFKR